MPTTLDPKVFEATVRPDLHHTVVLGQLAAKRRGTHATKNRAGVSGGGAKPFKQKGTGRARQGTIRANQHAGGGITFGPQPRSYVQRLPKKVRRAALRSALSLRNGESALKVVDTFELAELKTKLVVQQLDSLGMNDVLIVTAQRDEKLERAARNLPKVNVLSVDGLNVRDVLARKGLLLVGDAVAQIQERLA